MKKLQLSCLLFFIITQYSFSQWATSSYPADFVYFDLVHFYNENTVMGHAYNNVFVSKDRGKSFEKKFGNIGCSSLQTFTDTSYFCASGKLMYAEDSYTFWRIFQIKNAVGDTLIKGNVYAYHFYFFNNGRGFLTADETIKTKIFKTNNFGITWSEVDSNKILFTPTTNHATPNFGKMYIFDSTAIVRNLFSKNKLQFFTHYGDSAYEIDFTQFFTGDLKAYAFKDKLNGVFLSTNQEVYKTIDGCKNLIKVTRPPVYCGYLDYAKGKAGVKGFYIAGTTISNGGGSFYSKDDGTSWEYVGDFYGYVSLDFYDVNSGVSSSAGQYDKIQYFTGLTGLKNEIKPISVFNIYPNPNNGNFTITSSEPIYSYQIYDISGRQLFNFDVEKTNQLIINHNLNKGLYFIKITSHKGVSTKRFIVD